MEDCNQLKQNIITKIKVINEKLSGIQDDAIFPDRNQMMIILNNLSNSIEGCDEKFLLRPLLDNVNKNINCIDANINSKQYNVNQQFLYELIKVISHLNNANGKQNLQGYQSAVNKNIGMLENDIESANKKLKDLKQSIETETAKFANSKEAVLTDISNHKVNFDKTIKEIQQKYEDFVKEYVKKQNEYQENVISEHNEYKKEYSSELIDLKKDIAETTTNLDQKISKSLTEFDTEKTRQFEELSRNVTDMIKNTEDELAQLKNSANEKIGYVASATYSNIYEKYSDKAAKGAKWWYAGTILSMLALVGLSIWWFIITKYTNTDYIALIAKVFATVGIAVVSRYCAIQASKCKVIETKLRKIQLQMATFDAFVSTLNEETRSRLKTQLTENLTNQKDWLSHDKDEIDIIKDFEKILKKMGYTVEIFKNKKDDETDQ